MKRVKAQVFADNFKEIDAKSLNDYQHRQIPELTDDQIARVWMFSDERDLNSFKSLLGQWGSADNLCSFVLSDETGITTLNRQLFGGMLYKTDSSGSIEDNQIYATPLHGATYSSKDGVWTAEVFYESTLSGDSKIVDLVIVLTETVEETTKEYRLVAEQVATLDKDEDVVPQSNVTVLSAVSCTAYYNDASIGTVDFIPLSGEAICDVPERYNIQSIDTAYIDGEELNGTYRSSGIFSIKRRKEGSRNPDDKRFSIVQVLRRKYITESDYSKTGTNWEIRNGREYRSGSSSPVLQLRNLDPSVARSIASSISSSTTTYTNEIHTTTDGLLYGTWYSLHADYNIEDDGSGTVLWFLSLHNNDDFWLSHYSAYGSAEIQFFKVNATDSSKEDFLDNYYFTPDLDWYYREGDSGNATKKNGETVDEALPSNAKNLRDQVEGRVARIDPRYSEDRDDWFLQARVVFFTESRLGVSVCKNSFRTARCEVSCLIPTKQGSVDLQAQSYFDSSANWYTSTDGSAIATKNGLAYTGTDTISSVGAVSLSVDIDGRQARVREDYDTRSDHWILSFAVEYVSSDERLSTTLGGASFTFASSPVATTVQEKGYRVSESDLRQIESAYASCDDGTMCNVRHTDAGNGRYNFEAIKVTTAGFATSFTVGGTGVYFGYHYKKKPTTDLTAGGGGWALVGDNYENSGYVLLGGYSDGGIKTSIDPSQDVGPSIKYEESDNTWSWNIRITDAEDESFGPEDISDPSWWLFRYGTQEDERRWVGRRLREQLSEGGTIDMRGRYIDVPAGEYGAHETLSGRRVLIGELQNQNIVDGRLTYDVYERVITSEIEDDDGWFFAGVVEATDREKRILSSLATLDTTASHPYGPFDSAVGGQQNVPNAVYVGTYGAMFHAYENAVMRRKTVQIHRKYFVRRPRRSDLESSINEGDESIWTAMERVADHQLNPDPLNIVTFSIREIAQFKFAVERRTLNISGTWFIDEDAFSRLTINGDSACRFTRINADDIENIDS